MIKFNINLKKDKKRYIEKNIRLRCDLIGLLVDNTSLTSGLYVEILHSTNFQIDVRVFNLDKSVLLFSWIDSFTWIL